MRILHYALGFPPYRTGGLTKYCTDLMLTQKECGHEVALLWPGRICLINKGLIIREDKNWHDIRSFEIVNPLPVPLDEGIIDIDAYTSPADPEKYHTFLKQFAPDVIHIHTLMGLHREFIETANELGIKTIFTCHDYYGLCPKVTLFHDGKTCDDDCDCKECVKCNQSALGLYKITLMQSPLYRRMKDTAIVKLLRKRHRNEFFEIDTHDKAKLPENVEELAEGYRRLRSYYISMLEKMSIIHFNSTVTESVYRRYFTPNTSRTISITHRDIADHRRIKNFDHAKLRLTYLGPAKPFKGFQLLISALDDLWKQRIQDFELHIYTASAEERPYITHKQNGYLYSQLEEIFDNTDLLIAPSLWYETFGFTVLEALSYGVPVLISENVGAKDLLHNCLCGIVTQVSEDGLSEALKTIIMKKSILPVFNENILNLIDFPTISRHNEAIAALYR